MNLYRVPPFLMLASSSIIRRSTGFWISPRAGSVSLVRMASTSSRLFEENLNIIYDSKCNVCKLEIDFLARRDQRMNNPPKLKMTDLESPDYNPNDPANANISYAQGLASMHAVTADGTVLNGVPVFGKAYEQVGLGWLFAITTWPVVKTIADRGYTLFAKYRTNLTRNSSVEDLIQAYEERQNVKKAGGEDCDVCQTKSP
jgi:predicted DCC family thiol-disulfide oxidoreductase YuxK